MLKIVLPSRLLLTVACLIGMNLFIGDGNASDLMSAIQSKNKDHVRSLLDSDADIDFNETDDRTGNTLLMQALLTKDRDIVEWLLERDEIKKTLTVKNNKNFGRNALMFAIELKDERAVETLLSVKAKERENAAEIEKERKEQLKVQNAAKNTPLLRALWHGQEKIAKMILDKFPLDHFPDMDFTQDNNWKSTALLWAARKGFTDIAKQLVDRDTALKALNQHNTFGSSPLTWAVRKEDRVLAEYLLAKGADPESKSGPLNKSALELVREKDAALVTAWEKLFAHDDDKDDIRCPPPIISALTSDQTELIKAINTIVANMEKEKNNPPPFAMEFHRNFQPKNPGPVRTKLTAMLGHCFSSYGIGGIENKSVVILRDQSDGNIAGVMMCEKKSTSVGGTAAKENIYIGYVCVDKDKQGKKIGETMFQLGAEKCQEELGEKKGLPMQLWVDKKNLAAIKIYRDKNKFVQIAEDATNLYLERPAMPVLSKQQRVALAKKEVTDLLGGGDKTGDFYKNLDLMIKKSSQYQEVLKEDWNDVVSEASDKLSVIASVVEQGFKVTSQELAAEVAKYTGKTRPDEIAVREFFTGQLKLLSDKHTIVQENSKRLQQRLMDTGFKTELEVEQLLPPDEDEVDDELAVIPSAKPVAKKTETDWSKPAEWGLDMGEGLVGKTGASLQAGHPILHGMGYKKHAVSPDGACWVRALLQTTLDDVFNDPTGNKFREFIAKIENPDPEKLDKGFLNKDGYSTADVVSILKQLKDKTPAERLAMLNFKKVDQTLNQFVRKFVAAYHIKNEADKNKISGILNLTSWGSPQDTAAFVKFSGIPIFSYDKKRKIMSGFWPVSHRGPPTKAELQNANAIMFVGPNHFDVVLRPPGPPGTAYVGPKKEGAYYTPLVAALNNPNAEMEFETQLFDKMTATQVERKKPAPFIDDKISHSALVLNGVPLKKLDPVPDWGTIPDQAVAEPAFSSHLTKDTSSGCLITEPAPDGRVWLFRPWKNFGDVNNTFPKGHQDPATPGKPQLSLQQTAMKEVYEETGLKVKITGFLGDYERGKTKTRYYLCQREGGDPAAAGWEAEKLKLVPQSAIAAAPGSYFSKPIDVKIFRDLQLKLSAAGPPPPTGKIPFQLLSSSGGPQGGTFLTKDGKPSSGSTDSEWYKDGSGQRWLIKGDYSPNFKKEFPELQTSAEVISSSIYRLFGHNAPETVIIEMGGKRYSAVKGINDPQLSGPIGHGGLKNNPINTAEFRRMKVLAAFLNDWDRLANSENIMRSKTNNDKLYVIDFGGSLGARAKGGHKRGDMTTGLKAGKSVAIGGIEAEGDFKKILSSFKTEVAPTHPWKANPTKEDVQFYLQKFGQLDDAKIKEIVGNAKYSDDNDRDKMIRILKTRRDGAVTYFSTILEGM